MKTSGENSISGQIVDIHKREIYPGSVKIKNGKIISIQRIPAAPGYFILPGLIDSHIHIESSMVTPGAFSLTAVKHGTTAVVSDPHEIANVLGVDGVMYMLDDARKVPLKFFFGAPSCIPATGFETNGASVDHSDIEKLLSLPDIKYLSEMMNYPGVIYNDEEVGLKIGAAKRMKKPVDGHAPGIGGDMLRKYAAAGISTDHECSTLAEALEKISLGMKILIREGSAARNLDALKKLYISNPGQVMLCSDDLHPEMLQEGHINKLISRLVSDGYNPFDVIRSATINPSEHYNLQAGLLRQGDVADLIVVDTLENMNVLSTWIDGIKVCGEGKTLFSYEKGEALNKFNCSPVRESVIKLPNRAGKIRVIKALEGELLTSEYLWKSGENEFVEPDITTDILKIVVKDRYADKPPAIGFIQGFGLKKGAFASSIAHDSHNIISVGTNDEDITAAINEIVRLKGGLSVSSQGKCNSLQLNIAGIMTTSPCDEVAQQYQELTELVRSLGCTMKVPFMTLSFMALLVIPDLKLSDRGLFDVRKFELVSLFTDE